MTIACNAVDIDEHTPKIIPIIEMVNLSDETPTKNPIHTIKHANNILYDDF